MKYKKTLLSGVVALAVTALAITFTPNIKQSFSYDSNSTWWDNNCSLPDGYTSIGNIADASGTSTYTTRGTITSIEGNNFFIQSQNRGIYCYNSSSVSITDFVVGNVVDVSGARSSYGSLPEFIPSSITLYQDTNPYPVITQAVSSADYSSFCTTNNISRIISLSGITVSSISSKTITFDYDGVSVTGYIAASSYSSITVDLTTYKNNSTSLDFVGILSIYNNYQIRIYSMDCLSEHNANPVTGISVSPSTTTIDEGETAQFSATVTPSNAGNSAITWSTSGGGSIDSNGLFTATTNGNYVITATAQDGSGVTGTASITINAAVVLVTGITVNCSSSTFIKDSQYTFTASVTPLAADNSAVTWSASAGSITSSGVYTASTLGSATITATAQDGSDVYGSKTITVTSATQNTEGTVIANPTLSGNTLGPIYSPGTNDQIIFTYLEMINLYGDSLIFDYGNFEVLIDGGKPADEANVMAGLTKYVTDGCLEVLIVTHPHDDHLGGLEDYTAMVAAGVTSIKYIVDFGGTYTTVAYTNYVSLRNYYVGLGATYYSICEMINNTSSNYPNIFKITDDVVIHFLDSNSYYAAGTAISNPNESSVCTLFSFGNNRILCCGDLTNLSPASSETYLTAKYGAGKNGEGLWTSETTNVVKANHHCSNTNGSNGSDWVGGTLPDYVVISAALVSGNRTSSGVATSQHPTANSLARYLAATNNVYCNIVNGTTHLTYATLNSAPTWSFDGRTLTYYDASGSVVSAETEKSYLLTQSSFYSQLYA